MDLFQVIILSIVEGATEFIPISSTGHLIIVEKLFGWKVPFAFELILQLGAFCAVIFFFRTKISKIVIATLHYFQSKIAKSHFNEKERLDARLGIGILIGSIPAGVVGIVFGNWIEEHLHTGLFVAFMLIVFGLVMSFFDKKTELTESLETITPMQIIKIGLWQALAVIPGVSRSGSTMSGALSLGFKREAAAEISFLLGLPIIIAAGAKGIFDLIKGKEHFDISFLNLAVGFGLSFLVGLLVIKFLLNFLKTNSFKPFVIYRLVAGAFFLILFFFLGR